MASEGFLRRSGPWILAVCALLTLQGADAQTNTTFIGVPGWGVALLVLTSLVLAGLLFSLICFPLVMANFGGDGNRGRDRSRDRGRDGSRDRGGDR